LRNSAQQAHLIESSSRPWGLTEYQGAANLAAIAGDAMFVAPRKLWNEAAGRDGM
jgi:hypothetical protein